MLECSLKMVRKNWLLEVHLSIPEGSVFCLFGASGAGKSSILSALAGYEKADPSFIRYAEQLVEDTDQQPAFRMPVWKRKFAYVEQSPRLFPHLSIAENILYGVTDGVWSKELDLLVHRFQLQNYLSAKPRQLSGGLQQRVSLVRALATSPRVLLLDEPFSALDWRAREEMQDLVLDVHTQWPVTTVFVTHQLSEAQRVADFIAIVDEGRLLQVGTVGEVFTSPASPRVARLIGYSEGIDGGPWGLGVGSVLMIHPDRVWMNSLPDKGTVLTGRVLRTYFKEGHQRLVLDVEEGRPPLEITGSAFDHFDEGSSVSFTVPDPVFFH